MAKKPGLMVGVTVAKTKPGSKPPFGKPSKGGDDGPPDVGGPDDDDDPDDDDNDPDNDGDDDSTPEGDTDHDFAGKTTPQPDSSGPADHYYQALKSIPEIAHPLGQIMAILYHALDLGGGAAGGAGAPGGMGGGAPMQSGGPTGNA